MIEIIAIGKKHESWVREGIELYEKRLKQPWNVHWTLLPHAVGDEIASRRDESSRLLSRLPAKSLVILLDERGEHCTSPKFSARLERAFVDAQPVTIIIGGAYGVSDELRERADEVWSLSPLVFPHQLVRLILIEQLYRAQEIARGGSYHHA